MSETTDQGEQRLLPPSSFHDGQQDLPAALQAELRDASFESRLAAICLAPLPLFLGVLLIVVEPPSGSAVTTAVILMAASLFSVGGAWWLVRITKPPFAAFPRKRSIFERQPETGYQLCVALTSAVTFVDHGYDVVHALDRAAPVDPGHPARVLADEVRSLLTQDEPASSNIDLDWVDDPVTTLKRVAVRVTDEVERASRGWAHRARTAPLVPFVCCILPAVGLLALLVGRG